MGMTYKEAYSWGTKSSDGEWSGATGMLVNNEADLAATALLLIPPLMSVIAYTTPVGSTKTRMYIKRPSSTVVNWEKYTLPFSGGIWASVGLLMVICSGTIVVVNSASKNLPQSDRDEYFSSRFSEIMFLVFGAFCSQGLQQSTVDPVRIIHVVVHLTALVVLSAYSAYIISFLAVNSFIMPFTTMEGLLQDGTYKFAVVNDSADSFLFEVTTDKILKKLRDDVMLNPEELPRNYLEGLQKICEKEKLAMVAVDYMAKNSKHKLDCTLEPLDAIMQVTVAMAVNKKSPYRGIINSK
ncbi:probable glutamate receptor [Orussus abietinus]|uniref:probable glutamate receptor n=1 Tax=Orussus abietinus TaxID=222816 RepID=UPI000C715B55|nr:probable glutamate receptor [Orussus abietinus]